MRCRTTLAVTCLNGFAALTVCIALLTGTIPTFAAGHDPQQNTERVGKLRRIGHIIVIYQENWSFDALYDQFPGADGLANGFDTLPQKNKATAYSSLIYTTPS